MIESKGWLAGTDLERALARSLGPVFVSGAADTGIDFMSSDGAVLIELKSTLSGVRDLQAALLQTASRLDARPEARWGVLLARIARLSPQRARIEFDRAVRLFRPEIARRIGLVAFMPDGSLVFPHDPELLELQSQIQHVMSPATVTTTTNTGWTDKSIEVWKVLLDAWLHHEGPLTTESVGRRSESSYPTVKLVLSILDGLHELRRSRDRRIELAGSPARSLAEVIVMNARVRHRSVFVDTSGRPTDMARLLRRIEQHRRPETRIGGVAAARHHQPEIDLNGIPRIDLATVRPMRAGFEQWLHRIDPALIPAARHTSSPALVVHHLPRNHWFAGQGESVDPVFADPAETLLNLYEMRLNPQAEAFVTAMRRQHENHV